MAMLSRILVDAPNHPLDIERRVRALLAELNQPATDMRFKGLEPPEGVKPQELPEEWLLKLAEKVPA